jgi:hypothetical protein
MNFFFCSTSATKQQQLAEKKRHSRHISLIIRILLVSNQHYDRVGIGQIARIRQPARQMIVRDTTRNVIHQKSALSILVRQLFSSTFFFFFLLYQQRHDSTIW